MGLVREIKMMVKGIAWRTTCIFLGQCLLDTALCTPALFLWFVLVVIELKCLRACC